MSRIWWRSSGVAFAPVVVASVLIQLAASFTDVRAEAQSQQLTSPGGFFDNFDRKDLGNDYEVIDYDANRITVSGGKLVIVGTAPAKNRVILQKHMSGDFVATVALFMEVGKKNSAGLQYYIDDKNVLYIGIAGTEAQRALPWSKEGGEYSDQYVDQTNFTMKFKWPDRRQPFFTKKVEGQDSDTVIQIASLGDRPLFGFSDSVERWYIQLRRDGSRYTGSISSDGVKWTRVGSHALVQSDGRISLRTSSGGGVENPAEFDDLRIQE